MGRAKGGTNQSHSKEEKLSLVLRNLNGETARSLERETGIYHSQIHKWTKPLCKLNKKTPVQFRIALAS